VLLQGKGHSNNWTASERLMPMDHGCQTIGKQLEEPAARAGEPVGLVSGATHTNVKWWHSDVLR
jgi:hypothetical protein